MKMFLDEKKLQQFLFSKQPNERFKLEVLNTNTTEGIDTVQIFKIISRLNRQLSLKWGVTQRQNKSFKV